MFKYPVDVKKIEQDRYEARLVDFPNGPNGLGGDPYSALEDLEKIAKDQTELSGFYAICLLVFRLGVEIILGMAAGIGVASIS